MASPRLFTCFVATCLLSATSSGQAEQPVDFNREIRPLLAAKCLACHGPDEEAREAELRLDVADDPQGPFQPRDGLAVLQPGDLQASALWYRLTTEDEGESMPPPDAGIEPLTAEQVDLIRRWIMQGANFDRFWAFVPPQPPTPPTIERPRWARNPIDRFVKAGLDDLGKPPQPRADRRTLLRRVTLDLTGLPPTPRELRVFLADRSPDAYQRVVDRLMSSPRYGEHMARYWLDLVRFADTNGIHHDHYREMTPYRDWVIRSFNENLPFDQFVVDQVAGDLHERPTTDQLIASGFHRLHLVIDKGTAIPEESFVRNVIDRVTSFGTAFMGMTVGCAVCHDHKYDPLTQRDFYQLFAFFNNIDATPETPGRDVHAPFIRVPDAAQQAELAALEAQISQLTARLQSATAENQSTEPSQPARELLADEGKPTHARKELQSQLQAVQKAKQTLESTLPVSLVMKEREAIRPTYILIRGAYDQPGAAVERDTPSFLPPLDAEGEVKTRMDLARWLIDPQHPLTTRVTVNRFWQQFFGVGLVKTSEDFGTQGQWPSHPQLLDHLAVQFMQTGWDVKHLVRSIVCSQTYQQSSAASPDDFKQDLGNRYLARGSRFRLDAETIRDQILFVSGLLNESMYGRSVKVPQPPDLWKNVSMRSSSTYAFEADQGPQIHRRSVYSFWKRALPPPQMTIFDAPTRESCTARRERTNTPLQALVLMNESQYFKAAKYLASRLVQDESLSESQRLEYLYELVTSQLPDDRELSSLQEGLQAFREAYRSDPQLAKALTADVPRSVDQDQRVEWAAYTMVVNAIFNLDVTKTRE